MSWYLYVSDFMQNFKFLLNIQGDQQKCISLLPTSQGIAV